MINVLRLIIELTELQIFCVYVHSFSYYTEFFILNYGDSSDHICRLKLAEIWSQEAFPVIPFTVFAGDYVGKSFCSWIQ